MKEKIGFLLLGIIGVVLINVVTCAMWDQYWDKTERSLEQTDITLSIDDAIDGVMNPAFISYQDVMQYVYDRREIKTNDSVLLSMPSDVLQNVADVVIGRQGYARCGDLVKEYNTNYNNLYKFIKDHRVSKEPDDEPIKAPQETLKVSNDTFIMYQGTPYKKIE